MKTASPVSAPALRTVAGFGLELLPSGKLQTLVLPGGATPLFRTDESFDLGEGRRYRPDGWDECFPTIEAWNGSPVMGELIWAEPAVRQVPGGIEQRWSRPDFAAMRTFRLRSARELELAFRVRNDSGRRFEFLWASHAVFSVEGLRAVTLPDGRALDSFSLDGSCSKSFVRSGGPVRMERADAEIQLETDQPWWGLWLNRGGWPAARPAGFGCLGIEATNCPGETPAGSVLEPGQVFSGTVVVRTPARGPAR